MDRKITFVYFDAGGGHRSAATALAQVIEQQRRPWDITQLNLQELLERIDPIRQLTGIRLQDTYNRMIEAGYTFGTTYLLRMLQLLIRIYHRPTVTALQRYWAETRPDMVVSLIPHFNRAMAESVRQSLPGVPFVTILTDLANYPPHFWMERESDFLICGTEAAASQARSLGLKQHHIFRSSGMILNPRFYEEFCGNRHAERIRLRLDPDLPTGIVLFGGCGAPVMREIVERLDSANLDLQLIVICGRNKALFDALKDLPTGIPKYVEAFTRNVPYYMHLSDFFIGKSGPGSISEAVAMQLPVIVECNSRTLPQERYNAAWVKENGVGIVLRSFRDISSAVRGILEPGAIEAFRGRAASIKNRAVFEIPGFLAEILQQSGERAVGATDLQPPIGSFQGMQHLPPA